MRFDDHEVSSVCLGGKCTSVAAHEGRGKLRERWERSGERRKWLAMQVLTTKI
jgi:hypothetical protein